MVGLQRTAKDPGASRPSRMPSWRPSSRINSRVIPLVAAVALVCVAGQCRAHAAQTNSEVRAVTSSNWTAILEGEWMVTFYAPWCPACQQIQSEWESFGHRSHALDINVGKVDVTQEPGLSGRFFVTTLPTIFHAKNGVFRKYHGSRMVEDLHTFISEKKWKVVEPVAGWKSPSSLLMSGMAGLFHLSGWIRQIHNYFTGPLEIPVWGSYIIFIVATLLLGLILGLILVLLVDCFCPSKAKYEVLREEMNEDDLEDSKEDQKVSLEEQKDVSENEGDEEDADHEDGNVGDDDDDDDDDEENNGNGGTKDSEEDSAMEDSETEEEDNAPSTQDPSPPESESTLRQRKSEAVADDGH